MKVLILGDPNSIWVKYLIDEVLLPLGYIVSIQNDPRKAPIFNDHYKKNGVCIVANYSLSSFLMHIPKIRVLYQRKQRIAALKRYRNENYDFIFSVFTTPDIFKCINAVKTSNTKVINLFIGSDIIRANIRTLNRLKKELKKQNSKTVCTRSRIQEDYCKGVWNGEKKIDAYIPFGNSNLPFLKDRLLDGVDKCKHELGIKDNKVTIAIGYNGSRAQQHLAVINELEQLNNVLKKKITLLLLVSYAGDKKYIEEIRNATDKAGIESILFENYMNSYEIAGLRIATDIFIHSQLTDAFSASVLESFYAGSIVLNGSWLNYPEVRELNLNMISFDRISDIHSLLNDLLTHDITRDFNSTKEIDKYGSWDIHREEWNVFLNNCRESQD